MQFALCMTDLFSSNNRLTVWRKEAFVEVTALRGKQSPCPCWSKATLHGRMNCLFGVGDPRAHCLPGGMIWDGPSYSSFKPQLCPW